MPKSSLLRVALLRVALLWVALLGMCGCVEDRRSASDDGVETRIEGRDGEAPDGFVGAVDVGSTQPDRGTENACDDGGRCPEDRCTAGEQGQQMCGLNARGQQVRECEAETWTAWSVCIDPDECVDDTVEPSICEGIALARCVLGHWAQSTDPQVQTRGCGSGRFGRELRTCGIEGWSAWSGCGDPGVCSPTAGSPDTQPAPATDGAGPVARLVTLDAPNSPPDAIAAGCDLRGVSAGSAFAGLEVLLGDGGDTFNEQVTPDGSGLTPLVLLATLVDVQGGDTGNTRLLSDVGFGSAVNTTSTEVAVTSNAGLLPSVCIADKRIGGRADSDSGRVSLRLGGGGPWEMLYDIGLSQARLSGVLDFGDRGFGLRVGILAGYVTRDTMLRSIEESIQLCGSADPPPACESIGGLLAGTPETIAGLLLGLLGLNGFDVEVRPNGEAIDCTVGDPTCNAIGACFLVEFEEL